MGFGTKGCIYNCGDVCTKECIIQTNKYSIPIYENGVKTEWTIDGIVGDDKYNQLISLTPEGKLPEIINVGLKK